MLEIDPQPHRNYVDYSPKQWGALHIADKKDLPAEELKKAAGLLEVVTDQDVQNVYRPLLDYIFLSYNSFQKMKDDRLKFLKEGHMSPFIIGFAGSVGVGKSTTGRILERLLSHALKEKGGRVQLMTTDGFLYSNETLVDRGLMSRKGFPESYDHVRLLNFLHDVRRGKEKVETPKYSHEKYNIIPGEKVVIDRPDILIMEGLNILQTYQNGFRTSHETVSDYFDFSLYLDADADIIEDWYITRFLRLRADARDNPEAFFYKYRDMNETEAKAFARKVWNRVNLPNLIQNIAPSKHRADVILEKVEDHSIGKIKVRNML
ncbi:MAG: type I pantothenate kinase [Sneathiellales bacterium]|nr:type I pantothenate kinase [Sneathiellales bacterium]